MGSSTFTGKIALDISTITGAPVTISRVRRAGASAPTPRRFCPQVVQAIFYLLKFSHESHNFCF